MLKIYDNDKMILAFEGNTKVRIFRKDYVEIRVKEDFRIQKK